MRSVLVCGYYGFSNAGDEAILAVLLDDLRRVHPGATVSVLAGSPEDITADHRVEAIHWQEIGSTIEAARASDLMVLGGGGLFQDHHDFDPALMLTPRHSGIAYYGGFALLAALTGTPLAVYGNGVGPLSTEAGLRYTRIALAQAGAISVRDRASLQLVGELGIEPGRVILGADPAFLLETPSPQPRDPLASEELPEAEVTIGVSARPWRDDSWHLSLAQDLDHLVEGHDARVVFVPFHQSPHKSEDDARTSLDIMSRMRRMDRAAILRGGYTPAERQAILGGCDLVIGMRLHAVVFAANTLTPVVALSYDPKVAQVMTELGCTDYAVALESVGRLGDVVAKALEQRAALTDRLGAAVPTLRARALRNREVLSLGEALPLTDVDASRLVSELALARSVDSAELERTRLRAISAEQERSSLEAAHGKLATTYQELLGSRSMQAVNRYWKLRGNLKNLGRRLRGIVPEEGPRFDAEVRRGFERQLGDILSQHAEAAGVVIFPHAIGWTASLFQRPQQMALAFARRGYLTLYNTYWGGAEQVKGFRWIGDRLCLFALPEEMLDVMQMVARPIVVRYAYNYGWLPSLQDPVTIFEHIDDLEVFAATHDLKTVRAAYAEAIARSEVVAASALDLHRQLRAARPDAVLCPNGVDFRHFAGYRPGPPPEDLLPALARGPVIGYYGAIADWMDYELLESASRALSDHAFVFIGPDYDASMRSQPVFSLPNVWWLGRKDYDQLPSYLHYFDVATIPFRVTEATHSVSPLKLFEYMAGGCPVVTTSMRESARYPAVLIAADPEDWVVKLKEAVRLRHDRDHQRLLRRTARANTWDQRVGTLIDALMRAEARKPGAWGSAD